MATDVDPIVGNWYQRLDKGQEFEVVAFDEEDGIVEIQHSNGETEQLDIDSWYTLELEDLENPDDPGDCAHESELDDLEYDKSEPDEEDWDEPQ